MSAEIGKYYKIRHIVRLRQMLLQWRNKAKISAYCLPPDVPAGHAAVCVGTSYTRLVVRAALHLNHLIFENLLVQAEEEYGFTHQGPIMIPCDDSVSEQVIRYIARFESGNSGRRRYCQK